MTGLERRISSLKEEHIKRFGGSASVEPRAVIAPYRICPLGAHVDHQLGRVSGMTIDSEIALVFNVNESGTARLHSNNFPGEKSFSIREPLEAAGDWSDYARGAAAALQAEFSLEFGIDATIDGNMPIGGLSSSAAVGVAYLLALEAANGIEVSRERNIEFDGAIEHNFIKLANGILDQSVILLSEKDRLLLMDCESGKYETTQTAAAADGYEIIVAYSGVAKKLADTDYNKRVRECEEAALALLRMSGEKAPGGSLKLRHVSPAAFEEFGGSLDEKLRKRAAHFFSENARVALGSEAWRAGDMAAFGELMKQSCESSIHNYECGCGPMIDLAGIMNSSPGVYGARFSGAGFRGSCVGFSDPAARESIAERIKKLYDERQPEFADRLEIHFRRSGDGARIL